MFLRLGVFVLNGLRHASCLRPASGCFCSFKHKFGVWIFKLVADNSLMSHRLVISTSFCLKMHSVKFSQTRGTSLNRLKVDDEENPRGCFRLRQNAVRLAVSLVSGRASWSHFQGLTTDSCFIRSADVTELNQREMLQL